VLTFLQGLLQGIIKDKPEDPYSFVAKQFALAAPKENPPAPSLPAEPPVPPTLPPPPTLLKQENQDLEPLKATKETDAIETPTEKKADEIEQLRLQARTALLEGAQSGKLMDILSSSSQQKPAAEPVEEAAKETPADEIEQLRLQARTALLEGAQSGKLMDILSSSGQQKPTAKLDTESSQDSSHAVAQEKHELTRPRTSPTSPKVAVRTIKELSKLSEEKAHMSREVDVLEHLLQELEEKNEHLRSQTKASSK